MTTNFRAPVILFGVSLLVGCSSAPPEPSEQRSSIASGAGSLSGYVHRFSCSRFAIGAGTTSKTEFRLDKVVGTWGVFATRSDTQMVLAEPNADAPSRSAPPFPGGDQANNAAVKAYFLAAGLPGDQVLDVHAMPSMGVGGFGPDVTTGPTLEGYYSYISRQYLGIPIVDSYAWARLDEKGEVVTESVYWPEIPQGALEEAKAFAQFMGDPTWKSSFLAKLPAVGQLVIHHTSGVWTGAFQAHVSYDVSWHDGKVLHFGVNGTAFDMPEEVPGAWGTGPSTSKPAP